MRRRARKLGIAAGLGGAGLFGVSWWLGGRITAPARAKVGPKPEDLSAESVEFWSSDRKRVRGWWLPGQPGAGAIVLLHPMHGDRRTMVDRARLLATHGIGSLLVDLRAHGETRGDRITFGLREAEDAHAAVGYARQRAAGERLGVVGFSLGGAAAVLGAAPVESDAIVLEAVYPSISEAIRARVAMRLGRRLAALVAPLFVAQIRPRLGAPLSALRPIEGVRRLRCPVLVAGGTADPKTPLEQTKRLFAAAPAPKELWLVEGAGHEDLLARDPEGYRERVLAFLRRHLDRRG